MTAIPTARAAEQEFTIGCPVCPASQIPPDSPKCDHCGTDLRPILRVRELSAVYFNRALAAAAEGDHNRALEALYASLAADTHNATARVMLGKILWRLGHRRDAVQQWTLAAQEARDHQQARRLLAEARKRRRTRGALTAVVIITLGLASLWLATRWIQPQLVTSPPRVAALPSPPPAVTPTAPVPSRVRTAGLPGLADLADELDHIVSLRVERRDDKLRVLPLEGLFPPDSATPERGSDKALEDLATAIRGATIPVRVTVIGYTDDAPPQRWKDNWSLALARASRVVDRLRSQANRTEWYATSRGDGAPPFPNDSSRNRARNRTVMLILEAGI
jgi:flagellar motor protein MotB